MRDSESLGGLQTGGVVSPLVFIPGFFFLLFVSFDKISKTFQVGAAHVRVFCPFFFFLKAVCRFVDATAVVSPPSVFLFFSSVFFSSLPQCRLDVC